MPLEIRGAHFLIRSAQLVRKTRLEQAPVLCWLHGAVWTPRTASDLGAAASTSQSAGRQQRPSPRDRARRRRRRGEGSAAALYYASRFARQHAHTASKKPPP